VTPVVASEAVPAIIVVEPAVEFGPSVPDVEIEDDGKTTSRTKVDEPR
jgi:hypothetical protein